MGMSGSSGSNRGMMAEINVTPLVDVMLVLLIIFMISSSIETIQVQQEKQRIEKTSETANLNQKVPVNLPRTDAEPVNLSEEQKLVLSITPDVKFFVGETMILDCLSIAPAIKATVTGDSRRIWSVKDDAAFGPCLDQIVAKLGTNAKLQNDKELYLRADRSLPYGLTLKVMARIRSSGVGKFGLVSEAEGGNEGG
ncbi:MAG TPA: biopolymer transporter ExbD [Myxococcota bacterium]|nr:biopolymer transporter ExbD [Myxococcota bacterium]HOA13664.1 biopolymer transporter ExbD [Myxococcota bacterium]HOC98331.1 biopolymer transporter ExbD [Myxococcota bacterium]HOH76346.1 biopolymer transporter ExbD [Myxococcota bacterium]HPV03786.1 biopolymer transporter ExbD [Myxococcota bacterium]